MSTQRPTLPTNRAFVVQVHADAVMGQEQVGGRVEYIVSGQATHFESVGIGPAHFARLLQACRAGNAPDADRALTLWLDCLALPRTAIATETSTDAALAKELHGLQEALIGRRPSWSGAALASQLRDWRRHVARQDRRHLAAARLPELNPIGKRTG